MLCICDGALVLCTAVRRNPYLPRLVFDARRDSLKGYQASARGGAVRATVYRGEDEGRVLLKGKAVTVFHGFFRR